MINELKVGYVGLQNNCGAVVREGRALSVSEWAESHKPKWGAGCGGSRPAGILMLDSQSYLLTMYRNLYTIHPIGKRQFSRPIFRSHYHERANYLFR